MDKLNFNKFMYIYIYINGYINGKINIDCKGLLNILSAAPPDILPMVLTVLNEYFVCLDVLIESNFFFFFFFF